MEADSEETVKERQCKREAVELRKRIKTIEGNIAEECDTETRMIMKKSRNDFLINLKKLEEDAESEKLKRQSSNVEIKNRLDLILHAKDTISNGSTEQKRNIVLGLGSNWKVSSQNLHYEPHFVHRALKVTKKSMTSNPCMLEPKENRSESGGKLDREKVSMLWSG
jgi:hypothetical protein